MIGDWGTEDKQHLESQLEVKHDLLLKLLAFPPRIGIIINTSTPDGMFEMCEVGWVGGYVSMFTFPVAGLTRICSPLHKMPCVS